MKLKKLHFFNILLCVQSFSFFFIKSCCSSMITFKFSNVLNIIFLDIEFSIQKAMTSCATPSLFGISFLPLWSLALRCIFLYKIKRTLLWLQLKVSRLRPIFRQIHCICLKIGLSRETFSCNHKCVRLILWKALQSGRALFRLEDYYIVSFFIIIIIIK